MRRTPLTTMALACALALAACGGADEIAGGPSSPPSIASSSPSASSSRPASESPEDFIRRWLAAADSATATGATAEFQALSDPACDACMGFVDEMKRIYSAGGHIEQAPTTAIWIRYTKARMYGAGTAYHVRERIAPSRFRESADGSWKRIDGGIETDAVYLITSAKGWQVREFAQLAGTYSPLPAAP